MEKHIYHKHDGFLLGIFSRFLFAHGTSLGAFVFYTKQDDEGVYILHVISRKQYGSLIESAFTWSDTPEGVCFWESLNCRWHAFWDKLKDKGYIEYSDSDDFFDD